MANLVDPAEMLDMLATHTLRVPSPTHSHSHHTAHPIPTIIPDLQVVEQAGKRTLWVVFVVMILASAIFTGMSWRLPVSKRLYHIITTLITIIAAISYFGMATGHGVSLHRITGGGHHHHHHKDHTGSHTVYRQVFWARYVDWALTTPLLLLDLMLLAGANGATIFMAITADLIMIVTGLFAAFGSEHTAQKWGWYTIACIAYIVILWHIVLNGRAAAQSKGNSVGRFFTSIAGYTIILWTAYPIVWGVADGARRATVDQEIIAYAILDILAKPVFGLWLLIAHSRIPETNLEIHGFWSQGLGSEGRIRIGEDDDGA